MWTSESRLLSCLGIECGTRCQMCDNGKPEAVCECQGLPLDVLVQDARCVTTGVLVAQNLEQLLVVSVGAVASKSSQHMGMYPYMLGPPSIRDFAVHTRGHPSIWDYSSPDFDNMPSLLLTELHVIVGQTCVDTVARE